MNPPFLSLQNQFAISSKPVPNLYTDIKMDQLQYAQQLQYNDSLRKLLWQQQTSLINQQNYFQASPLIPVQSDPASAVTPPKKRGEIHYNDYTDHQLYSQRLPTSYVKNVRDPIEGYPKLQKLRQLKRQSVEQFATKPYGYRCEPSKMIETLNQWIMHDKLCFDVIMLGALTENQFIYPFLTQLPLDKLCSKPGFLFIWSSTQKINELNKLLATNNNNNWSKKFRRSEELVFVSVTRDSPYYPYKDSVSIGDDEKYFQKLQWHCWMCITGTVRRSTDNHLIHCNLNTDLLIEKDPAYEDCEMDEMDNNAVPNFIYQVAENFSSSTRRLHIIPSRTGFSKPVKVRQGWVILSPDILLNNFKPDPYKKDIERIGHNIPFNNEIELLRPKSPDFRQQKQKRG